MRAHRAYSSLVFVLAFLLAIPAPGSAFTFKSPNIDIKLVFQAIAREAKVNIILDKGVRGSIPLDLQNVDALEAMKIIASVNKLKVRKVEAGGQRDTYVIAEAGIIEEGFDKANSETVSLRYAKAEEMAGILSKGLGKSAKVTVEVDARTNSLVVNGTKDVIEKVMDLIKKLDRPVPQVIIDSKVVQVQTNYIKNLGFSWDWGTQASGAGRADGVTANAQGGGNLFAITEFQRKNFNANLYEGGATGAPFFSFGDFYRGNWFLDAAFQALETSSISRTLASPRVLAINGAKAELRIGDKVIFSGGPSQPPEERDTGTNLDITPRINNDGFITMEIEVTQSSVSGFTAGFPTINQIRSKTTVQVRDSEEVLVGGLVSESSTNAQNKIPFLADIPLIKYFFTFKSSTPQSRELVILITPRVVKQQVPQGEGEGEAAPAVPGVGGPSIPEGDNFEPGLDDLLGDGKGGKGATKPAAAKPPTGTKPAGGGDDLGADLGGDLGGL
ncbi:MAG: type IV pilus assembly protein PilQ [bacterium]|nr:MAG: type IV pilus assembly protein PilQ [bacterium]